MNLRPSKYWNLADAAFAPATISAYNSALRRYFNWLVGIPPSDDNLADFLDHLFDIGRSPSVAKMTISAVSRWALENYRPSPVGIQTKETMAGFARLARDRGRGQAIGISWEEAEKIARACEADSSLRGLRDAALISLMSDCLLRISEASNVRLPHLSFSKDGTGTLEIPFSKTDKEGAGFACFIGEPTVQRIHRWTSVSQIKDNFLFRPINRGDTVSSLPLGTRSIARIVASRAGQVGIVGATGHSLRVGGAQSLAAVGADIVQIQHAGHWKSPVMAAHYSRAQAQAHGPVAKFKYGKKSDYTQRH